MSTFRQTSASEQPQSIFALYLRLRALGAQQTRQRVQRGGSLYAGGLGVSPNLNKFPFLRKEGVRGWSTPDE
ncbi:MAG: hypothetical protein JW395_1948 [Nitrospira sp.]|nr:hypothetical protein [Nitrospira sp.]